MSNIYLTSAALITPLGSTIDENITALKSGISAILLHPKSGVHNEDLYLSLFKEQTNNLYNELLEKSLQNILTDFPTIDFSSVKTGFIISSTKGNLSDLASDTFASTRELIKEITKNTNQTVILSNACISGVSAINIAANSVRANIYDHVIVIGIDLIWDFVKFGFQSLYAISSEPVRPFDKERKGVNLGEACATIIVSKESLDDASCYYLSGSNSNDANHISGPSRTGEGLVRTINQTLKRAQLSVTEIDFISAHGTGTLFNDEMEAIAFDRLSLQNTPLHSLKGIYGHTLGAAGVLETIVALSMLSEQLFIPSKGFSELGTSKTVNVVTEIHSGEINTILKTASGFGGGNASLLIQKKA